MKTGTIYYQDEMTDDFAGTHIRTQPLRKNYCYIHRNIIWRAASFVIYRIVAQPLVFLFSKIVLCQRFKNRKVMKSAKETGAYIYGNHTNLMLDAFLPSMICPRKRGYIIAGLDTMSIRGIGGLVEMLGAIPLGSTIKQKEEMLDCVNTRIREHRIVAIYPEAHIWPYYTGIRPYTPAAFFYPVHEGAPVYAMTNCYQKEKFSKRPKVLTFMDGPYYADRSLPPMKQKEKLRDQCYEAMRKRSSENSTYEYITYVRQKKS